MEIFFIVVIGISLFIIIGLSCVDEKTQEKWKDAKKAREHLDSEKDVASDYMNAFKHMVEGYKDLPDAIRDSAEFAKMQEARIHYDKLTTVDDYKKFNAIISPTVNALFRMVQEHRIEMQKKESQAFRDFMNS